MRLSKEEALIVLEATLALQGHSNKLDKCTWVAQDAGGTWWGYPRKPTFEGGSTCRLGIWDIKGVEVCKLCASPAPADASKMVFKL